MILAIDTATRFTAVSVAQGGEVVFARAGEQPRAHVEEIGPLLDSAMSLAGAKAGLREVVVGRGPGSFAGLRVGLAAGRTLAWALGIPVRGVCTLDAIAIASGDNFTGFVVTDARRRELFYAEYLNGVRVGEPGVGVREDVADRVSGREVVGDVDLLTATDRRATGTAAVDPVALGRLAEREVARGAVDPALPLYLRAPDIAGPTGAVGSPA